MARIAASATSGTAKREAAVHAGRLPSLDALRGIAICLMVIYHFCFDLNHFAFLQQDFNRDWFWLGFRGVIVTLFLFTVGVSLGLQRRVADAPRRFLHRLARIAGCALLVSGGSYLMFPQTFIYFGILHFIAVASVLAWPLADRGKWNLVIAIAALAVGNLVHHPWFDQPWLNWIGMATYKPATEDYVPLLPWFGVVALGLHAGRSWLIGTLRAADPLAPRGLAWLGRHSLFIYMVHQPILIGLVWAARTASA